VWSAQLLAVLDQRVVVAREPDALVADHPLTGVVRRVHHTRRRIRLTRPAQLQPGNLKDPILVCQPLFEEVR
jgi:hypothetical protein